MEPSTENEKENSYKVKPILNIFALPKIPKIKRTNTITVDSSKNATTDYKAIPFGKLNMHELTFVPIPDDIKRIVYNDGKSKDDRDLCDNLLDNLYTTLYAEATNTDEFIANFTTLIHLEEAANTKPIIHFHLYGITLELTSNNEQLFKIVSNQNVSKWIKAFNEKKIDSFELKLVNGKLDGGAIITGRIHSVENGVIVVKIISEFQLLKTVFKMNVLHGYDFIECQNCLFNLEFQTNRAPYLLQHSALNWIKQHNLFEIIIKNPEYEIKAAPDDAADISKSR